MANVLETDDRGRVTLPPAMREHHGRRYIPIDMPDGIHLYPVPKGPPKLGGKPESLEERKRRNMEDIERDLLEGLQRQGTPQEKRRARKR